MLSSCLIRSSVAKLFSSFHYKVYSLILPKKFYSEMAKPTVYVTRKDIPQEAIDLLRERCDVSIWTDCCPTPRGILLENVQGKDAIYCTLTDSINKELIETAGTSLKVVSTMSVGYDHIDVPELKTRNIKIGYTPDVLTDAVADLTVGLLLATSRRFFEANKAISNGTWSSWSPLWMCGQDIKGSVVGIVGFGRIGSAVAARLLPFGVKQILYSSRSSKEYGKQINAKHVLLGTLLSESDFIIVTCALTPETTKMFDAKAFNQMKSNAVFINTSRGALVDQEALYNALVNNKIKAAGLDVMTPEPLPPNHPLLSLDNCVIIPHIGSATLQTRRDMAILAAKNLLAALDGKDMPAEVI